MTGDFDSGREIGYVPLDANGTATITINDPNNPVATESRNWGSVKSMWH